MLSSIPVRFGCLVKTPAPTAVNNNGAALASVSVNVIGGQGTLPYSKQAMAGKSSAAAALCRRHADHRVYGAGMSVSLSSDTAVDLTCIAARVCGV